jgi:cytochrome P450
MHRSKEIYGDDANEFRPERWEDPRLENMGFAFMPFHGAPRVCLRSKLAALFFLFISLHTIATYIPSSIIVANVPTEDFALMEASYGLVRLLQAFPDLRIAPVVPQMTPGLEKQNLTIVVSSADGCKVLLR